MYVSLRGASIQGWHLLHFMALQMMLRFSALTSFTLSQEFRLECREMDLHVWELISMSAFHDLLQNEHLLA